MTFTYFNGIKKISEEEANNILKQNKFILAVDNSTGLFWVKKDNGEFFNLASNGAFQSSDFLGKLKNIINKKNNNEINKLAEKHGVLSDINKEKLQNFYADFMKIGLQNNESINEFVKSLNNLNEYYQYNDTFGEIIEDIKKTQDYADILNGEEFKKHREEVEKQLEQRRLKKANKQKSNAEENKYGYNDFNMFLEPGQKQDDGPYIFGDNPQYQQTDLDKNQNGSSQIDVDSQNILNIGKKVDPIPNNDRPIKIEDTVKPDFSKQDESKLDNQINNNIDVQKLKENPNLANKLNESLFKGNNQAYEALVQNRKIVNEPYFKEEDLIEDRDDFDHELFESDYHFFNANGPLTREQAIYCYNHDKTFGVLRDDSASLIRNSEEGVYEHSLDRRSTYRKMANRLEEGKRWYNSSSPEYAAMSEILNSLAKDDDVLEPFCLGELRDNINKYKKNFGNKKASGEPSDIAKLRYNLVREIESELREIEKDRAVEHHFDDARGFAEFQKEFPEYEYNIDTDVENSFEPEDINVYEDQKFDLKEFLKSGKGTYHDYLANGAKLAAQDPRNKPFYEYLIDAAKEVAGGEEQSEATGHFEKAIKNGKADKLTNKDYAALEADRQKKKGDGIMDEVGKFSMYWNVLKLVTLVMAGTGPLGIAAAFLKSFMWSSAMKIGWSLFNKVKDTVKKYKDDKKAAKEYSYALRHGKTDDAKEIRKKQIERVIKRQKEHQMALRNKQNGLKNEQKAEKVENPAIEKQVVKDKAKIVPEEHKPAKEEHLSKSANIAHTSFEEQADNLQKDKNDGNKLRKQQTFSENPFKEINNIKDDKNKLAYSEADAMSYDPRKTK